MTLWLQGPVFGGEKHLSPSQATTAPCEAYKLLMEFTLSISVAKEVRVLLWKASARLL